MKIFIFAAVLFQAIKFGWLQGNPFLNGAPQYKAEVLNDSLDHFGAITNGSHVLGYLSGYRTNDSAFFAIYNFTLNEPNDARYMLGSKNVSHCNGIQLSPLPLHDVNIFVITVRPNEIYDKFERFEICRGNVSLGRNYPSLEMFRHLLGQSS